MDCSTRQTGGPDPQAVSPGTKCRKTQTIPASLRETRQYLCDFNRLNAATTTARELYDAMLGLYPDRVNPGSLWGAANTAKKQAESCGLPMKQPCETLGFQNMRKTMIATAIALVGISAGFAPAALADNRAPLNAETLTTIRSEFGQLMELANRHDIDAIRGMFWQSPSALLVAKSAIPAEGNWAGFWGNTAIDRKLHDIAASGPVVLQPDFSRFRVVGLTRDVAKSYAPVTITVSYAGQDGTPKPFLMIINWIRTGKDWKIASEIILPVPPTPAAKG